MEVVPEIRCHASDDKGERIKLPAAEKRDNCSNMAHREGHDGGKSDTGM